MNLLEQIKTDRAQKKKKQPFRPTLFDRISGLVLEYRLGEGFLDRLESPADFLLEKEAEFVQGRKKQPFRIPLFSLVGQEEYALTLAIIAKINNPYLEFAQSPEEIALSKLLFELNPALGREKLERHHFETLLLYEQAKIAAKEQAEEVHRKTAPGSEKESLEEEGALQGFMTKVDENQGR